MGNLKSDFYFLQGYQLCEEYQKQNGKEEFKQEFVQFAGNLKQMWSELDPYMLTNFLPKHTIPKEHYDDFIRGIKVCQDYYLLQAYLEVEGVKDVEAS